MEFDLNGDGLIQKNELKEVMVRMGQCPTEDELDTMFRSADRDDDGNIDLEGWCFFHGSAVNFCINFSKLYISGVLTVDILSSSLSSYRFLSEYNQGFLNKNLYSGVKKLGTRVMGEIRYFHCQFTCNRQCNI